MVKELNNYESYRYNTAMCPKALVSRAHHDSSKPDNRGNKRILLLLLW